MLLVQYKDVWHGKHLDKYLPNKYANIFMKLTKKKSIKNLKKFENEKNWNFKDTNNYFGHTRRVYRARWEANVIILEWKRKESIVSEGRQRERGGEGQKQKQARGTLGLQQKLQIICRAASQTIYKARPKSCEGEGQYISIYTHMCMCVCVCEAFLAGSVGMRHNINLWHKSQAGQCPEKCTH